MLNFTGETTKFKNVILFFQNKLKSKDFSNLSHIKLYFGSSYDGACFYPLKTRKTYYIFCRLNKKTKYPEILTYFVRPKLKVKGLTYTLIKKTDEEIVKNCQEEMVWLLGHELFHFLRDTKQIKGKNTQAQANEYGFECLREFKITKTKDLLFSIKSKSSKNSLKC
jgi:hypothetical protein